MKPYLIILGLLLGTLEGCQDHSATNIQGQGAAYDDFNWNIPDHIPLPLVPDDNPMTESKFQLGRALFYDIRLSGNGTQSCASCHHQDKAFTDGLSLAVGSTGETHPRSSQSLTNIAYNPTLTWANPSLRQLEQQILIPLFSEHPIEQGITDVTLPEVVARLKAEPRYAELFAAAYAGSTELYTKEQIVKALAVFVRGLNSFNSPYDRYQRGELAALSASALRGRALYFGENLECFHCHGSYNLTDSTMDRTMSFIERPFHNTGLFNVGGNGDYPAGNRGIFEITANPADMGKFRAPSLRNIELTGPYMHDGSIATLADVLDFYAAGGRHITSGVHSGDGRKNPFKDGFVTGFRLDTDQKQDVIEFLKSFTDQEFVSNPRFSDPWPTK